LVISPTVLYSYVGSSPFWRDRPFLSNRFFFVTGRLRKRRRQLDDADFQSLAMAQRERIFRPERGATIAPLRVNDCQFALGFGSANLRKKCRPQGRKSALCLLLAIGDSTRGF
jgi:hypothetical protein